MRTPTLNVTQHGLAAIGSNVYAIGGLTYSGNQYEAAPQASTFVAEVDAAGALSWSTGWPLPAALGCAAR